MKRFALGPLLPILLLAPPALADPRPCTHQVVHISGTIRDRDGAILHGAIVTYRALTWKKDCSEGVWKDYKTKSDANGFYSVKGPEQGKLLAANPNRPSYPAELALKEDFRVGNVEANYQLHMFRLRGRIVGRDGLDAEGITVQYAHGGAMDLIMDTGKAIKAPKFELFLPRGPWAFIVTRSGESAMSSERGYSGRVPVVHGFNVTLYSDTAITYTLKP